MEIGRLKHHVARGFVGSTTLSAENAGDAHRLLGVANGKVVFAERVLLAVERDEFRAFGLRAHHDFMARHHIGVEAVHRLSVGHHHVVRDVHNVVDGTQADGRELLFEPVGAFFHVAVGHAQANVAFAGFRVLDFHVDGQRFVIDHKSVARRTVQRRLIAVLQQPGVKVACHAPVRERVGTVGRDIHFDDEIALKLVVFRRRSAHHSIVGQHDDALVRSADANLVLGTNHAVRLVSAQLRPLDLKLLVAVVEHAAHVGHDDLLSGLHVRRSAHDLLRLVLAQIHGRQVQVRVGNILAGKHLSDIEPAQSAANALNFLNAAHFQTNRGQCGSHFVWRKVEIDVFFQPFV